MLWAAVPACARLGRAGSSAAAGGARPPGCGWSKRHHSRIARVTFAASIVPVASCLGSGERKQSRTSEVARGRAAATAPAAGAPRPRGVDGEQDSGRAGREHLRADDVARGGAGGKRGCERPASGFYPASERGSERERLPSRLRCTRDNPAGEHRDALGDVASFPKYKPFWSTTQVSLRRFPARSWVVSFPGTKRRDRPQP